MSQLQMVSQASVFAARHKELALQSQSQPQKGGRPSTKGEQCQNTLHSFMTQACAFFAASSAGSAGAVP